MAGQYGADRANVNVAEIDVPAVLAFWISTAGEGGHGLLKRSRDARGKPLGLVVRSEPQTKRPPEAVSLQTRSGLMIRLR